MVADRLPKIKVIFILPDKFCKHFIGKYIHRMEDKYCKQVKFFCSQSDLQLRYADQPVFLTETDIVHVNFCQGLYSWENCTRIRKYFFFVILFQNKLFYLFSLFSSRNTNSFSPICQPVSDKSNTANFPLKSSPHNQKEIELTYF